jgi:hypothetical protein
MTVQRRYRAVAAPRAQLALSLFEYTQRAIQRGHAFGAPSRVRGKVHARAHQVGIARDEL